MELALELKLGTVEELKQRMLHEELVGWVRYARKHLLPGRRLELYLARVSQSMRGGKLADHLIQPAEDESTQAEPVRSAVGAEAMAAFAGAGVRVLGKRRRRKGGANVASPR